MKGVRAAAHTQDSWASTGYGGNRGRCGVKWSCRKGWVLVGNGRAPARPTKEPVTSLCSVKALRVRELAETVSLGDGHFDKLSAGSLWAVDCGNARLRRTLGQYATYLNLEPPTMNSLIVTPTNLARFRQPRPTQDNQNPCPIQ
jgi:hypothetical protein